MRRSQGVASAVALEADRLQEMAPLGIGYSGAVILAPATRPLPAVLSRRLHGEPDRALWTAAVTGTNGKTTVSYLLQEMLDRLHGPCGLLGTIRYDDGRTSEPAPLTTPGGPVFYEWLGRMRDNGCASVAMELSSHGLDQDRTAGLGLDVAVMTNLGRDHLDYHRDTAAYLRAKARILDLLRRGPEPGGTGRPGTAVINADDPHLRRAGNRRRPVVRFSARPNRGRWPTCSTCRCDGRPGPGPAPVWNWTGAGDVLELDSPLVGRFNVGEPDRRPGGRPGPGTGPAGLLRGPGRGPQVPGRLERIRSCRRRPWPWWTTPTRTTPWRRCWTPAGELTAGRLLVVFGCGGDRDRGKRPLMGAVAAQAATGSWITSDNPRSEDPAAICADILAGYSAETDRRSSSRHVEPDRRTAIGQALDAAGPGDVVVIAGKGHEDYQLVGDQVLDLDDRQVIHRLDRRKQTVTTDTVFDINEPRRPAWTRPVCCAECAGRTADGTWPPAGRGDPGRGSFAGAQLDSRQLGPGQLFVGHAGRERADGRRSSPPAALERGHWVLAEAGPDGTESYAAAAAPAGTGVLVTADPAAALACLAADWRSRRDVQVVGVTGTNGKTTTKDLLAALLRGAGRVHATAGNFNNDLGRPADPAGPGGRTRLRGDRDGGLGRGGHRPAGAPGRTAHRDHHQRRAGPSGRVQFARRDHPRQGRAAGQPAARRLRGAERRQPGVRRLARAGPVSGGHLRPRAGRSPLVLARDATAPGGHCWTATTLGRAPARATTTGPIWPPRCWPPGRWGRGRRGIRRGPGGFAGSPHRGRRCCEVAGRTILDDSYNANPGSMLAAAPWWPWPRAGRRARRGRAGHMAELGADSDAIHRDTGADLAAGRTGRPAGRGRNAAPNR